MYTVYMSRLIIYWFICISVEVSGPTNVKAIILMTRVVRITWNPSTTSGITSYIISYSTNASYASGGSVIVNGSITNVTVNDLEENTLYVIGVQALFNITLSSNISEV